MPNYNGEDPKNDNQSSSHHGTNEKQDHVKVLAPEERDDFRGITINTGDSDEWEQGNRSYYESKYSDPHKRVYVRRVKLNSLSAILSWLIISLAIIAVVIIALPFLLYLIIPMLIIGLISNLFRRH